MTGDTPRRHWGLTDPAMRGDPLPPETWTALKACANLCGQCGAPDALDAWGRWHTGDHLSTCWRSRARVRDHRAASHQAQTATLRVPRRVQDYD